MSARTTTRRATLLGATVTTLALLAVAGCSGTPSGTSSGTSSGTASPSASADAASSTAADRLTATDPWIKAAESGMTAAFAVLHNDGDQDVTVVGATSDLSPVELHEMATDASGAMVMRQKEGGLTIPAGGEHALEPGGDHLMLMELSAPVQAGAEYEVTLELSDGSTLVVTAPARTFAGAKESYDEGHGEDHDMSHDG
ncbi:copper chaperone PCu(A)C [Oerskovia paurometabola]|uniref:Copper chaperone PCu(A)C n=1 Tax=Oerskovia paurometabola TaxID=162170 RepID=A0ABW1XCG1_9CELL|nr:copper chaperone PCu(A)C [Oerskovia paurometabola]MBM7499080.1 copper(I)-binding protein [Oerskovia paurometabola]